VPADLLRSIIRNETGAFLVYTDCFDDFLVPYSRSKGGTLKFYTSYVPLFRTPRGQQDPPVRLLGSPGEGSPGVPLEKLPGAFREVAGCLLRNCREPLEKLLGASKEVAGSLFRSCWELLKKLLGASLEIAGSL
jgi:hypothetical protein